MHYDQSDTFLSAAFAVVKRFDADTYNAMRSAAWHVTTDAAEFSDIMARTPWGAPGYDVLRLMSQSQGNTIPADAFCPKCDTLTFINPAMNAYVARQYGVSVAMFTSATLVHEFHHRLDSVKTRDHAGGELAAFHAMSVYAARLPGSVGQAIARDARDGAQNVLMGDYPGVN